VQSAEGATTSAFEQALAHNVPWNGRHGPGVELSDPTFDLAPPSSLSVIVDVLVETGKQGLREGCTILRRQSQSFSQERGDVALHQVIVVAASYLETIVVGSGWQFGGGNANAGAPFPSATTRWTI
jgi:hypothetical protein